MNKYLKTVAVCPLTSKLHPHLFDNIQSFENSENISTQNLRYKTQNINL